MLWTRPAAGFVGPFCRAYPRAWFEPALSHQGRKRRGAWRARGRDTQPFGHTHVYGLHALDQAACGGARWAVWGPCCVAPRSFPTLLLPPPPARRRNACMPQSASASLHPASNPSHLWPSPLPPLYTQPLDKAPASQANPPPRPTAPTQPSHVHRCPPPSDARLEAATE